MKNRACSLELTAVHPDLVLEVLSNMKTSSSCGIDEIGSSVLKLVKTEITPVLTHIINLSISQQTFPSVWKKQKLSPCSKRMNLWTQKIIAQWAFYVCSAKFLKDVSFFRWLIILKNNSCYTHFIMGFGQSIALLVHLFKCLIIG